MSYTLQETYNEIIRLLRNPEATKEFVKNFNDTALLLESRNEDDDIFVDGCEHSGINEDGILPSTNHVVPWIAFIEKDTIFIASPPITDTRKGKSGAFRLAVDAMNPINGEHVNAVTYLVDENGNPAVNIGSVCLYVASPDFNLVSIFACWDCVARNGIKAAIEKGYITRSWMDVVQARLPCNQIPKTEKAAHAMKMFDFARQELDVEKGLVAYLTLREVKGDHAVNVFLKDNIKFCILGMKRNVIKIDDWYKGVFPWLDIKPASWMFDTRASISTWCLFSEVEGEIYNDWNERDLARKTRDHRITSNSDYNIHDVPCKLAEKTGILPSCFSQMKEPSNRSKKMKELYSVLLRSIGRNLNSFNGLFVCKTHINSNGHRIEYKITVVDTLENTFASETYSVCRH
jgi:hypothetical protein